MTADREVRRGLDVGVETPVMTSIFDAALAAGAWGGRVCGAGGGGCLALMVPPDGRNEIQQRLAREGYRVLEWPCRGEGLELVDRCDS
jgi:D-glycero-alpha-D-manno-heptose-7-phosphate kinase